MGKSVIFDDEPITLHDRSAYSHRTTGNPRIHLRGGDLTGEKRPHQRAETLKIQLEVKCFRCVKKRSLQLEHAPRKPHHGGKRVCNGQEGKDPYFIWKQGLSRVQALSPDTKEKER